VQARYDAPQGGFWRRVSDFGYVPEQDNVWLGQLGNTKNLVLEKWLDRIRYRLFAPRAIVVGRLISGKVGVNANGLLWIVKA
jgi:hypothetical protein